MPLDGTLPAIAEDDRTLLLRAAALLETEGWCIGEVKRHDGRRCINGALRHARGVDEYARDGDVWWNYYGPEDNRLAILLGFTDANDAAFWNNDRASAEPVIDRLRLAATGAFV